MMKYKGFDENFGLSGKTALVTGASRGLGKAIVEIFARKGAQVMLTSSNSRCEEVAAELRAKGYDAGAVIADLRDRPATENIVSETVKRFGKIDILVNNAGIGHTNYAEDITDELWDEVLQINLNAPFFLCRGAGKQMMKQKTGGRIINVASMAAVAIPDKHAAYSASKAGLVVLTRALAYEWADFGITVNAVSSTIIMTDMGKNEWDDSDLERIPLNRFLEPEEVASVCLYLASDAAAMVTGINFQINGGDGLSSMYKDRKARPAL
jgi:NAD(P)-dependent dehydrogenase (short-subunit alcohol dehydrogenase family)